MVLDLGFVLGDGLQYFGDAVANLVLDNVPHKEHAQEHTHTGEHQDGPWVRGGNQGQFSLNPVDGSLKKYGGKSAQGARHDGEHQQRGTFGDQTQKGPDRAPD